MLYSKVRILSFLVRGGGLRSISWLSFWLFMVSTTFPKKAHFLDQGGIFIKISVVLFDGDARTFNFSTAFLWLGGFLMIEPTFQSDTLKLSPTSFYYPQVTFLIFTFDRAHFLWSRQLFKSSRHPLKKKINSHFTPLPTTTPFKHSPHPQPHPQPHPTPHLLITLLQTL